MTDESTPRLSAAERVVLAFEVVGALATCVAAGLMVFGLFPLGSAVFVTGCCMLIWAWVGEGAPLPFRKNGAEGDNA